MDDSLHRTTQSQLGDGALSMYESVGYRLAREVIRELLEQIPESKRSHRLHGKQLGVDKLFGEYRNLDVLSRGCPLSSR